MIWVCCPTPQKWHTYNPLLCKEFATPLYNLFHEKTLDKSFFVKQLQNTLSPYEMLQGHLLNSHLPNPVPNPTPPHFPPRKKVKSIDTAPPSDKKKIKKTLSEKSHPLWEGDINRIAPISYQSQRTLGTRLEWPSTGALKAKRYPHNTVGQYC